MIWAGCTLRRASTQAAVIRKAFIDPVFGDSHDLRGVDISGGEPSGPAAEFILSEITCGRASSARSGPGRLGSGCEFHDLGRDLFLAKPPFALQERSELSFRIIFGGYHRGHPGLVLGYECMHGGFAQLRVDVFRREAFEQQLRRKRD